MPPLHTHRYAELKRAYSNRMGRDLGKEELRDFGLGVDNSYGLAGGSIQASQAVQYVQSRGG